MHIHQKSEHLFLIDLDQEIEGFRQFISAWVYQGHKRTLLIDPGPASTIPILKEALRELQVNWLDYILLTHIHIDHAGGTGLLMSQYPEARVACHPKGISHMINPDKLWQGSLKVLGKIAETYGSIAPVRENLISYPDKIEKGSLEVNIFETPGHASHHLSYLVDGILFLGEAAGVNITLENDFYLRIATPPKFNYEVYKESLFKASKLDCDRICFGHYDMREDVQNVFNKAKDQLELWMDVTRRHFENSKIANAENIFNELVESDPCIKAFGKLEKDVQKRERYFALNSINGMLGYLAGS
ncbi:MAG: MBL fold metallo-hydrolase [Calditrichaeota bacterium]|nr:MAG: MBL fold metallo-hydrolase [Calditrichota bacterium]MBL1205515.1 MBL fold metallo-hydrolase [Calditrichota bacterium]NOG45343.1 MBL fold metallo-hydrolase [Calditrichota bacterium]